MSGNKIGTIFAFVCGVALAIAVMYGCVFLAISMAVNSKRQNAAEGVNGADTWVIWFGIFLVVVGFFLAIFLGRVFSKFVRKAVG